MSNRTRTGDLRDHNPTPANPLLDVKAYKIGVKRPCHRLQSVAFHCSILRGFRTVSTKCGRNVVVEWSSNGAISNGRSLHVGLPFGCRARGETETAREVSVRGDKPFERPARRISRGRHDRASERQPRPQSNCSRHSGLALVPALAILEMERHLSKW